MTRGVQTVARLAKSDYVCPSCILRRDVASLTITSSNGRALYHTRVARKQDRTSRTSISQHPQNRRSYSLASSTAINAPSNTPSQYKDVHRSFGRLQEDAAAFADLSRIQLALKSFESDSPTIRVGLLTLGAKGTAAARSLARVLLSDALGSEQSWEKELVQGTTDGRSILLRYGETDDLPQSNAVIKVMPVPSQYLQKHKLEILITPLRTDFTGTTREEFEDALLVPSVTIPASAGRVGFVRNPVHKALIVAGGINGAVQLGKLPSFSGSALISAVIDIAARTDANGGPVSSVDTVLASQALQSFRTDQAASFGDKWSASRVPELSAWLTDVSEGAIVKEYAGSTLAVVEQAVSKAADDEATKAQSMTVAEGIRDRLQVAINKWAAEAHHDLRNNLVTALDSRAWRRTAWFRLLWRIDDVSYSSTDILNQCWLNETEQNLAFLSGRILEAGLASEEQLKENGSSIGLVSESVREELKEQSVNKTGNPTAAELLQVPTMLSRFHGESGIDPLFDPPWPQTINLARQAMLHTNVPAMHRKAQALVLSTLSTIGGTSALGAWLCVATSGFAIYEAGAIAALGLVWSLRRLQRLWGKERDGFSTAVQDNGRKVLVEIETQLTQLVRQGGRARPIAADTQSFERARLAIEKCRQALAALK